MWTRTKPLHVALLSIAVLTIGSLLFLAHWSSNQPETRHSWPAADLRDASFENDFSAGNSTLGFEAILALSQGTKWRVDGLQAAARASGIQLQIPGQPGWSDAFIKAFEEFGPIDAHGAAMAWLGHIDLLKFVIQNRWGSALIMEDDVDWDVGIRNQTKLIAKAVLTLTKQKHSEQAPYGREWDVLWMGHCSDPANTDRPIIAFDDPTVISLDKYSGLDTYIKNILPDGQRSVHYAGNPVCTFAYAVSATGAKKLLHQASLGHGGAFDLMLMHSCQDRTLDCITVNPEIFDGYHPAEGDASEVRAGDSNMVADTDDVGRAMGHTDNILRSARCLGLFGKPCLTQSSS